MGFVGTALIYGIIGVVVATALALERTRSPLVRRWILFLAALIFWPVFAPFLLAKGGSTDGAHPVTAGAPRNGMEGRIQQAEIQLLSAMAKLDGVAEEVLAPEVDRVNGLAGALAGMARRLAEMESLLKTPELDRGGAERALSDLRGRGARDDDPRAESIRARLRNIERLSGIEARTREDLEHALLEMEEMSSQLLLLKFAGSDPEVLSRLRLIADTVEHLTEGLLAVG